MGVGFEYAAWFGMNVVPLQPFNGLDPANDPKAHFAIIGQKDRRIAA